ncbi:MAG: deaminase [Actinobacteria bacterium 69-20]|nr:dihydrofolate reductase [Actinomycetota bacterium]OJV26319.1 MAG: deaminase [Actinobacteria bacterium 69-20]
MGKVIVMNWLTLDGVMQGPGRPDEDVRGGFSRGGWGVRFSDEATAAQMGERLARLTGGNHAWLFGRWTYESLLASWDAQGGPFKDALINADKYVASRNPAMRLDWPNSTLLQGDVPSAVTELKHSSDTNLVIMGSGVLIGALISAEVIDEYLVMIAPVVLGAGARMFRDGVSASLRLTETAATGKGVIVATYETVRAAA